MGQNNSVSLQYYKYHALGNDYIVLREQDVLALTDSAFRDQLSDAGELSEAAIERICHRHFGIGSDGILLDTQQPGEMHSVRIFNPDGGEAEKSGNGLRIFSRFLWDAQRVDSQPFSIRTLGGVVRAQVLNGGSAVEVEMGRVSFLSGDIPATGESREVLNESLILASGEEMVISAASIGNPHCVVLTDQPSPELAKRIGPQLETHPLFPARTNVQFVKILNRQRIQLEIWERGAGYTLASGSSASATVGVLRRMDLVAAQVTVEMPGGLLEVGVEEGYQIRMSGPVTRVAVGAVFPEIFRFSV